MEMIDGAFDIRDGVLTITDAIGSGPILDRIRRMIEEARSGKADPAAAIEAIGELAPTLKPVLQAMGKSNSLGALLLLLWFIVEMTKALHPSGTHSSTTHVEYGPTTINQITINQGVSGQPQLAPVDASVSDHKHKNSKRKKRRLRAKFHRTNLR
ncbi:hypothetical protein ABIB99_002053 [Bradyrhizobium sp. LA6.1]|uniref:hypothetical protein n=1 Tax=Bradyrhizobium sp. LA6.1 TaxID=3156378 RepID=UPI003393F4B7